MGASNHILKNHHGSIERENRIRFRRHGVVDVLEGVQLLPSLLLFQRVRTVAGGRRLPGADHAHLGRRVRPDDGHHCRPHPHALGQVPPLSALDCGSVLHLRHPAVHHPRLGICRQTGLGLRHVHPDDDRVHGHQRALRRDVGRDNGQSQTENRILLLPHVLRLRRLVHRAGAVAASGRPVQRPRLQPAELVAGSHDSDCDMLLRAVHLLLRHDPREDQDRLHRLGGQGLQEPDT